MPLDPEFIPQYPLQGISISDLAAALPVIEEHGRSHPVPARVLQLEVHNNGQLWVRTGTQSCKLSGGGMTLLLAPSANGWKVIEKGPWHS